MGYLSFIIFIFAIFAGFGAQSFGVFRFVFFGGNILLGLMIGSAKQGIKNRVATRRTQAADTKNRLERRHIDTADPIQAYLILKKFNLLSGNADKYLEWEMNNSHFSNVPFSQPKIKAQVENSTLEDAENALIWLASEAFLERGQAQEIQNTIEEQKLGRIQAPA